MLIDFREVFIIHAQTAIACSKSLCELAASIELRVDNKDLSEINKHK